MKNRNNDLLTLDKFIEESLYNKKYGYYMKKNPFGEGGDFITAPNISILFSEMIAIWIISFWEKLDRPKQFNLIELGAGNGEMMKILINTFNKFPQFKSSCKINILEKSDLLKKIQKANIKNTKIKWLNNLNELNSTPCIFIANEFFDALPVRQFVRDGNQWRERCITVIEDTLAYGLTDATPHAALAYRLADTKQGDLVETCAPAQAIAQEIGHRINQNGGMALIIDYGKWRSLGDTLQSLKSHQSVAPLLHPGSADLTAHVDFEALAKDTPSAHTRPTDQGMFLERLGVSQRANQLAKSMQGSALTSHIAAHRRLTHPSEMGTLFKVMGFFPASAPPPPGLDI